MKIYSECEYCGKRFEKLFGDDYIRDCKLHELKEHSLLMIHFKDIITNKIKYYNKLYKINMVAYDLNISINYCNTPNLHFTIKYKDEVIAHIHKELDNKNYESKSYLEEVLNDKIEEIYEVYASYLIKRDKVLELQDKFNSMFEVGQYVKKEYYGRKQCVCQIRGINGDKVKLLVITDRDDLWVDKYEEVDILEFTCGYYWSITEEPTNIRYKTRKQESDEYWERYHELYKEMRDIYGEDASAVIRELEYVKGYKI